MASYTMRVLAETLKKIMSAKSLDTITVKEIVEDCGMNRKTFYYNFRGISDLLKWMLVTDICAALNNNCKTDTWRTGFSSVMEYLVENKEMMQSICDSKYWPEVRMYLSKQCDRSMTVFVEDTLQVYEKKQNQIVNISDTNMKYIIRSYSMLKFSLMEEWFLSGMKESIDEFLTMFAKLLNNNLYTVFRLLNE
ncbi:MAG: TetR family transcriptional regulator [Clostridiales bacterium]|nr:TetR family transcriptional regulator [Clostridiales bacterium]